MNSGFNTYVAAKRNVTTLGIRSLGDVALESELGQVNANGNIRSGGGDIYLSGLSRVNVANVISLGGNVAVVSGASSIKTGYIRTDSQDRQGNVSLDALSNVKVAGVVNIDGIEYSIYAGDEGTIAITHQLLSRRSPNNNNFRIGNISGSGALALVNPAPVTTPTPVTPPTTGGGSPVPILIWIEVFRRVLDAGGTNPAHQSEINPISGQPYADEAEFELVQEFTPNQKDEIIKFVNIPIYQLDFDYVEERGQFDTQNQTRCFVIPLAIHLGGNRRHNEFAIDVTSSPGDIIVIPPTPVGAFASTTYDGITLPGWMEFRETPSWDEFWDICHSFGRVIYRTTKLPVQLLALPTVIKHGKRFQFTGCVRSKRNCRGKCCCTKTIGI